ncbi:MAG: GntR family transcriptional regulator [Opitutales bacterium]|nr:GntR family transcriptional regulator [Opitutales bacterium]MCH8539222.1 GntR family transcriptional regulator [Opitutales bacterium]
MEISPNNAPSPGLMSDAHRAVRLQHRDERTEDYVEAVYLLSQRGDGVRVVDLQEVFGVSHVTVIRALEKLEKEGLVERGSKGIALTRKGEKLAVECYERHRTVESFLLALGVPENAAREDAEGIEHHLGEETLAAMERFLAKAKR